ncbi:unnamed protein product [Medioppia subpectinata]|uniref:Uncharacterized protein n=1 Tax=Medioppia subpectinata TaxID=1979941 RepID=A0A7R9QC00_9ACAR|nr:unnamed protein product [Medioppia subpectinata]CAG2118175.1 unnamed protein product [Medioppia subpectinata]
MVVIPSNVVTIKDLKSFMQNNGLFDENNDIIIISEGINCYKLYPDEYKLSMLCDRKPMAAGLGSGGSVSDWPLSSSPIRGNQLMANRDKTTPYIDIYEMLNKIHNEMRDQNEMTNTLLCNIYDEKERALTALQDIRQLAEDSDDSESSDESVGNSLRQSVIQTCLVKPLLAELNGSTASMRTMIAGNNDLRQRFIKSNERVAIDLKQNVSDLLPQNSGLSELKASFRLDFY